MSYSYDDKNVISFPDGTIKQGEILAAIGPSGSGKSTWLQLLSGILALQNGKIQVGEHSLEGLSERKRDKIRAEKIGLIFQNNHFLKDLSVADNLALPAFAQKAKLPVDRILSLAEKMNVDHLLNKKPSECSVGELQRLSILRTASTLPHFILADEPTSALDDVNTEAILNIFKMLSEEHSIGILIVTHDNRLKSKLNSINFGK